MIPPEPPYIPCWPGSDPIRYWISPEMRRFEVEIRIALGTWQRPGAPLRIRFERVPTSGLPRSIDFRLAPLVGILGLGMYPPPLNAEPASGDVTLNSDVDWSNPLCRPLVLPTLIHEIGAHSLGLGHLYLPESVRFPNISAAKVNLSSLDRDAVITLYGV